MSTRTSYGGDRDGIEDCVLFCDTVTLKASKVWEFAARRGQLLGVYHACSSASILLNGQVTATSDAYATPREVTRRRHRPDGAERGMDLRKTPPFDLGV